ncbi:phage holin family protein [Patescibacteria group bacterium]|nr:phage holin family protein [Patescibacteria group bacterium]
MSDIIVLFGTIQMQAIIILIAIDVVLAVIASLVKKDFAFRKLANFMKGPVLAYVLGFAVVGIVGQAIPYLALVIPIVFVLIVIALLASIIRNLGRTGVPLPQILKR